MSAKHKLLKIIEKCPPLRGLAFRLRNRVHSYGNPCVLGNMHCRQNRIDLPGSRQELRCEASGFLRESTVHMEGSNNAFVIGPNSAVYGVGTRTVYVCGNDNRIIVGAGCTLTQVSFFIRGSGNTIVIGSNCSAVHTYFHIEQDGNEIHIGDGTTLHGRDCQGIHMAADEGSRIRVGKDCMLAHSTQIRSTDSHSIVDMQGKRLNPAKDVIIGDHCWIGLQCILLKGTELAHNCMVAAGSVCSKKYIEPHCIVAGNPARIVKQEIDWDRKFI